MIIENTDLFAQVISGRDRLRDLSQQLVQVHEAERRFIANELHDEIGQNLTGLKLILDSAISTFKHGSTNAEPFHRAKDLVEMLIDTVHDLSLDLRPPMLDDLGVLPTLAWHIQRYTEQTNIRVHFDHDLDERFPTAIEVAAFRIVQESLTNVARHAGVDSVDLRVWFDRQAKELYIQVEDKGSGFDYQAVLDNGKASGLIGMQERVVLLGGQLMINALLGGGTILEATLPIEKRIERRHHER